MTLSDRLKADKSKRVGINPSINYDAIINVDIIKGLIYKIGVN
ncbi:hypothetical protein [Flavobacterium sp. W22_SRS_FP1]